MLHHWYHVNAEHEWREQVAEHLDALDNSGLDEQLTTLHVGVVGSDEKTDECLEYLASRVDFYLAATAPRGWEDVTLAPLHEAAHTLAGEDTILYAHTQHPRERTDTWRRSMTHWNVNRWQHMQSALVVAQTAGCMWLDPSHGGHGYWAGNFWWARADYVRTLDAVPTSTFGPEMWIGSKAHTIFDAAPGYPNERTFALRAVDDLADEPAKC